MRRRKHNSASFPLRRIEMHHRMRTSWNLDRNRHLNQRVLQFLWLTECRLQRVGLRRLHTEFNVFCSLAAHHERNIPMAAFAALHSADGKYAFFRVPTSDTADTDIAHDLPSDGNVKFRRIRKIR